jgi:hypothetical protein
MWAVADISKVKSPSVPSSLSFHSIRSRRVAILRLSSCDSGTG